jgi:hypothetical protein
MGDRTGVQIDCPHIIQTLLVDLTTEEKELGTDHRHGMTITTFRAGTIGYDAGPHPRFWSARGSNQLESVGTSKDYVPRLRR